MHKKTILTIILIVTTLLLIGCTNDDIADEDYQNWLNSNDVADLNNDQVINETDYTIYLLLSDYTYWLDSDEAADLNDDRVINENDYVLYKLQNSYNYWISSSVASDLNEDGSIDETDYELYLHPLASNYDLWIESSDAIDLNDDLLINEEDYNLYQTYHSIAGDYEFTNFSYTGTDQQYIGDYLFLLDFGDYFSDVILTVDDTGHVTTTLSTTLIDKLSYTYDILLEALSHMMITGLSDSLLVIDTTTTIDDLTVYISIYLTPIQGGFYTSYTISAYPDNPVLSFNLIKVS